MFKLQKWILWLINNAIFLAFVYLYQRIFNLNFDSFMFGLHIIIFNIIYVYFYSQQSKLIIKEHSFTLFKIFICNCIIFLVMLLFKHTLQFHYVLAILSWFIISSILNKLYKNNKPLHLFLSHSNIDTKPFEPYAICEHTTSLPEQEILKKYDAIIFDDSFKVSDIAPFKLSHQHLLPIISLQELINYKICLSSSELKAADPYKMSNSANIIKYIFDVTLIILLSPIWLPLLILFAIISLCFHGWPIFFTQRRVGQNGKVFTIYKLRTMTKTNNQATETMVNDARITKLGKFMRKCRLDEFPQFFNILKGDMSLIGPRPERPELAEKYIEENLYFKWREAAKPGISGWAQIHQGYAVGADEAKEKTCYDLFYIKHHSFWLDVKVALQTIITMLTGFGAK